MLNATELSQQYLNWVTQQTSFKQLNAGTVRIDSPFTDAYQDGLVMYALQSNDPEAITLTDDGWSNENLESHGLFINRSPQRKKMLLDQLATYGVSWQDDCLEITGKLEDFGHLKGNLLQAMIFVNDMFVLAPKQTQTFFFDDVELYFEAHQIRVLKNAAFMGKSGLTHNFEFSIPGTNTIPRKLIKLLSSPNNSTFAKAIFTDIYETRQQQVEPTKFFVFLNDRNRKNDPKTTNGEILSLFERAGATPVPYTERENYTAIFSE